MTDAAAPFTLHPEHSLVEIAGRQFPAVGVVCPVPPERPDETPAERLFSGHGGGTKVMPHRSYTVQIPTENGLLVEAEMSTAWPGLLDVRLFSTACAESQSNDDAGYYMLWIPIGLGLHGTTLVPDNTGMWRGAEPAWVVEFIDRVATLAFTPPPGPRVQLITLAQLTELQDPT